jgi:hypothetical protein
VALGTRFFGGLPGPGLSPAAIRRTTYRYTENLFSQTGLQMA